MTINLNLEAALAWLAPDADWQAWQSLGSMKYRSSFIPDFLKPSKSIIHVSPEISDASMHAITSDPKQPYWHIRWLHALAWITNRFLIWGKGKLALHPDPERVLEVQQLLGRIPLEPLLAFGWVVRIESMERTSLPSIHTLQRLKRSLPAYILEQLFHQEPLIPTPPWPELERIQRQRLVEAHRHLNGSGLMPTYWLDILRFRRITLRKHKQYPLIEAVHWLRRTLQMRLNQQGWNKINPENIWKSLFSLPASNSYLFGYGIPPDPDLMQNKHSIGHDQDLILERRFLCRLIEKAIECPDDFWLHIYAHAYLAWQAKIWRYLVQDRNYKGFSRFDSIHGDDIRYSGHGKLFRRFIQANRTGHVRYCDWRVTPKNLFPQAKNIEKIEMLESEGSPIRIPIPGDPQGLVGSQRKSRHGLICHWVRDHLWTKRENSRREGLSQIRAFLNSRYAHRLRGLDVANSEFHGWIAEYAPIFTRIRRSLLTEETKIPLPHAHSRPRHLSLTPHAGEDFIHLLCGMRAMDETFRALEMGPGDRIGHGLAMGIDPSKWFEYVGREIAMTRGEWLDALVWFRRKLLEIGHFASIVHQVEREIHLLANYIYNHDGKNHLTFSDLEHAQELRRYPQLAFRNAQDSLNHFPIYIHHQRMPEAFSETRNSIWICKMDMLALRSDKMTKIAPQMFPQPVIRRNEWMITYTPPSWDDGIRAVQRRWITEFSENGGIIEINPTSNLCIGPFRDIREHPVFCWHPPDGQQLARLVVGSDDPGVFATELAFEYTALIAAAKLKGHDARTIESWINRLVQEANLLAPTDNQTT